MKKLVIQIAICFCYLVSYGNEISEIQFYEGSFEAAKQKAGEEGKLFLVDFYADWCAPCKWMDKTTFSDSELAQYANDNIIALKVNIDDFDGYEWKQKYDVQYLPTILIFNTSGILIDRIEETMTAKSLLDLVVDHNHSSNTKVIRHKTNHSPRSALEDLKKHKRDPLSDARYTSHKKSIKSAYQLLMGTFEKYEDAFNKYHKLSSRFIEPIIVLNDVDGKKMIYKVLMGDFATQSEADDYRKILKKDFNIKSSVY